MKLAVWFCFRNDIHVLVGDNSINDKAKIMSEVTVRSWADVVRDEDRIELVKGKKN